MYRSPEPPNFAELRRRRQSGKSGRRNRFQSRRGVRISSVTPYEDFTAGEIDKPELLTVRRSADGKVDGTQIQMLSYLGETWGRGEPRFTTEQVIAYTRKVRDAGGAVTWDVPVGLDGAISQPFLDQLTALGKALNAR